MLFAVVGGLSYLASRAYHEGYIMLNNPPLTRYPVQGIDVSHHQGAIDWAKVMHEPRVQFAFIKATEGGDFVDGDFSRNWQGAQRVGLARGAYHFFTFCRPGIEQAQNYLATVPAAPDILPVTIDLEFGGNCPNVPSQQEIEAEVTAFVNAVQIRDPRQPIFYVTPEFAAAYMANGRSNFPSHVTWLRDVFFEPEGPCTNWSIWQFAANGRTAGITEPVDQNAFCGDEVAFQKLFGLSLGP
jgi:lysozyme